ncbi:unnamed protein product [Ixodes hexagonus]
MKRAKQATIPCCENDNKSLSATSDDAQKSWKSTRVHCESASGEPLEFSSTDYGENLGHEYVFKHKAFNTKRWMLLTTFFLSCFLHYGLHTRDVDLLGVFLVILLILLVVKLHRRVKQESLLVMQSLGLQTTTTFITGRQVSRFIDKEFIEDVIISEAITVQSVIFYLVVLLHDEVDENAAPSLVPLFHNTLPRLNALQTVYRGIQESGWT